MAHVRVNPMGGPKSRCEAIGGSNPLTPTQLASPLKAMSPSFGVITSGLDSIAQISLSGNFRQPEQ